MKKVTLLVIITTLLFSLPLSTFAVSPKQYANAVNVSIHLSQSLNITLNGNYQIINKDTNSTKGIPKGTVLTINRNNNTINVSYTGFNENSTKGFDIKELQGTNDVMIFSQGTQIRRGATSSYQILKNVSIGETAVFHESFTNASGELWNRVSSGNITGWVLASTGRIDSMSNLSLATINNSRTYRGSFYLKPNGNQVEVINTLDMEDYLKGVVPSEMPASWHKEALKAQAISARSYAANLMLLTSTTASQVYRGYSGEDPRSNAAIEETAGLLVKYNGKPIQTFFFSTSGGRTANVGDVWNSDQRNFPYLVSVEDPYESSPYSNWSETFTSTQILQSFGMPANAKIEDIIFSPKGVNGEIGSVTVKSSSGEKTISGNESVIRKLFPLPNANVYNQLYSNWFTSTLHREGSSLSIQTANQAVPIDNIIGQKVQTANGETTISTSTISIQTANGIITNEGSGGITSVTLNGKGWGHRIGMSQYGAKGFAENGWKAEDIIKHYYKGTTVSR